MNQQRNAGRADYYLPREIAALLTSERLRKCKNLGLLLDKYPPQTAIQSSEEKGKWLKEIAAGNYIDPRLAEGVYQRWLHATKAAGAQHFNAVIEWRMVVGLGGETVLETDLTLHHLYGIPYIPGSALKGLTRAYATGEDAGHKSEKIEDDDELVQRIFGTQGDAGSVIFFDAMPLNGRAEFELDIMNAHYPNYYSEGRLPTNDQNPNPVTFLTVANTTFVFALAARNPAINDVGQAREWLEAALQKYGVGGKTSAGYGYFSIAGEQQAPSNIQTNQAASTPTTGQQAPVERIRPNINLPSFREGQEITGAVVAATDDLRALAPSDARAFLRYQSFATKDVLIVVTAEEAQNWKPGETRICLFTRTEVRDGCTMLVCRPRLSKKKK